MTVIFSQQQVDAAIQHFGRYRTRRCQELANEGPPDGISGAHLIAMGLRETGLKNVRGGVIRDSTGMWIKQPDYRQQDVGWVQISQKYHEEALSRMVGVAEGTWSPVLSGKTAASPKCCPRFTDSLRYTLDEMHESQQFADDFSVPDNMLAQFAVAAHNAGAGGALSGYRKGNMDLYTTGGDYSVWVYAHVKKVRDFFKRNPKYKV